MSLSPALDVILRGVPRIPYLLGPFRFGTALSAPLTSPYAESGAVGSLTLVQTDGQLSTSGGVLNYPTQGAPGWGKQGVYGGSLGRVAGRALLGTFVNTLASSNVTPFAWVNATTLAVASWAPGLHFSSAGSAIQVFIGGSGFSVGAHVYSTTYDVALVLRSTGAFLLIRGGAFLSWTLLWVDAATADATLRPEFDNLSGAGTLDDFRVVGLPGIWAGDFGIATTRLAGARAGGDTFTHTADCLIEWTETTRPSALTTDFRFRIQDSTNYWQITIDSTGALTLNEVVAGTPTSRGTSAAAVANGNRVVVIAAGAVIQVFVANVLKITYSSATSGQTATSGRLAALGTSEAIADIVTWPRNVSIPAGY